MMRSHPISVIAICCSLLATEAAHSSSAGEPASPEAAVKAHYAALKSLDMDQLKRLHGDTSWANKSELSKLNSMRLGYRIVKVEPMRGKDSPPGDVYVKVEESFKDRPSTAIMHYQLRRTSGRWTIVNFNADEEPPEPPEDVVRPRVEQR